MENHGLVTMTRGDIEWTMLNVEELESTAHSVILAIQAGAASFLLKDVSPDDLLEAIRAAYHGESRLHPVVMRKLMNQVAANTPGAQPAPKRIAPDLTEREVEVLRLVAEGMSNREIAERLVISEKTVKTHVSSLLSKLGLEDRTRLAIYAIKKGLVSES
jgi:NarL family two-component system response regulator LiaR